MLETALTVTDAVPDPAVSESFPSYHAFIRARIRALPPSRSRTLSSQTGPRRLAWSKDRRAMLAAEFLASDEAEDLSDRGSASHCADRIIDYGCDKDFGRPLRMSPTKVEAFLLGWLPRKVMLIVRRAGRDAARAGRVGALGRPAAPAWRRPRSPNRSRRCSTRSAGSPRPTGILPSSAWTTRWSGGCCRTPT